jgi:hypothetical protein
MSVHIVASKTDSWQLQFTNARPRARYEHVLCTSIRSCKSKYLFLIPTRTYIKPSVCTFWYSDIINFVYWCHHLGVWSSHSHAHLLTWKIEASTRLVLFSDPTTHARKGSGDIGADSWFCKLSNHMIITPCAHAQQGVKQSVVALLLSKKSPLFKI